jgi:hypothetical protein
MPAALTPLRILLGALCVFFAYYLGRAIGTRLEGRTSVGRLMHWLLRVTVTAFGVAWGGLDRLAVAMLCLAALLAGLGFYSQQRPARRDDPQSRIFPGS